MDAKSIYEELLKQGIPEKLVTWSNKADSIDILIQDYNEKVYKEALKFFKGYEGVRVDYTIDHETALWCDDVSKYSSDEFIRSITDFYYTLRAKGLAYTESKKSARKSIKESTDDIITVKEFCFWGHSGNIVEIWTIDGVLCDSFEVRNVGKSEYKNYEIHGWDCAKNTVIIYITLLGFNN